MTEDSDFDVRLSWQDREAKLRNTDKDSVAVGTEALQANTLVEGVTQGELESDDEFGDDVPDSTYIEDQDDEFEWTEERERALEEALDESPEGTVPRVQVQLEAIKTGLESQSIDAEQGRALLTEVDKYLKFKIENEQQKIPVEHSELMQSRKEKLNALFAYQEAATALREYVEKGEAMQLKVAAYATEQGGSFLNAARELLMNSEPDYEEFEEFEDEEYDSDEEYDGEEYDSGEEFDDDEEFYDDD